MGFDSENNNIGMHLPTLIKRPYIPKDKEPSHLPTIFDEKHEMALLGFINLGLNEQEVIENSHF